MNKQNFNNDAILEEKPEEIAFNDKRRFDNKGERIKVEVKGKSKTNEEKEDSSLTETKSPEVIKLENALKEISARCEAAETKLQEVQKRFEKEKAVLEKETAERRKRMKKSLEQKAEQERFNFLTSLLPVLDNLNLAIDAGAKEASFENLLGGIKGIARSFEQAMLNVGVKPIKSVDETFDPELHEAVEMIEADEKKDGKIISEYSRGYTFKDRLLRPAKVRVGNASAMQKASE